MARVQPLLYSGRQRAVAGGHDVSREVVHQRGASRPGLVRLKPPNLSLRVKAILAIIAVMLLLLGTFVSLGVKQHHAMMEEEVKKNTLWLATTLATSLGPLLNLNEPQALGELLDKTLADEDVLYVVLRKPSGELLAVRQKARPLARKLVAAPFDPNRNEQIRELGDPGHWFHVAGHVFEIVKPVHRDGETLAWLQLGIHTVRLNREVARATYRGIRLFLLFFLLGAIFIILIDRKVQRILSRLIHTIRQMASGDFSQRVEIKTGDALEELGESCNRMADALRERDAQIQQHQQELEIKVATRTRQLRDEKTKLKAILDHVPSGFLLLDREQRVQMVSANFETITGRPISNLVGKCCTVSLWNDQLCRSCLTHDCLDAHEMRSDVVQVEEAEKSRHFERVCIPIRKRGRVEYVLEIITEITQRQLLQENMIRAEKLAATGEMAAVIAHEMRNSLTSVNMILQLLKETAAEKDLDLESIQVALNSIQRMERVVGQLLRFARPKPLLRHASDLNALVRECVEMTRPHFQRHGASVELALAPDMPLVHVDGERFKEALVNLLLNAEQALDGQGQVRVRTGRNVLKTRLSEVSSLRSENGVGLDGDKKLYPEIVLPPGTETVFVEVTDTGCGIARKHLQRIFDPFFTTKINGTGLGLPLVKRTVNEHGGLVRVHSKPGKGSTFTILLPVEAHA